MTQTSKVEECSCVYREHIEVSITAINFTKDFTDLELGPILDFELNGPEGQPVLRIRFCPWCGKRVVKVKRITHFDVPENTEGEEWKNQNQNEDDEE